MAYFEWSNAIELGHPLIDAQHKRLLELAEALVDPLSNPTSDRTGVAEMLSLIAYAREHFAMEEELMRSAGYPEEAVHSNHHASLQQELKTYCARIQRGQNTNPAGLISFLWNWLVLHIDGADRNLVIWLRSREPASSA